MDIDKKTVSIFRQQTELVDPTPSATKREATATAFWDIMEDAGRDTAAARLHTMLADLSPAERFELKHSPVPYTGPTRPFDAALPLGIAAKYDNVRLVNELLRPPACLPWLGEPSADGLPTTAAYWGALYGSTAALEALHAYDPSLTEPLRALNGHVDEATVRWLMRRGAKAEDLERALPQAIMRGSPQDVATLVRVGRVDLNRTLVLGRAYSEEAPNRPCSYLTLALLGKFFDVAKRLLELGAKPDHVGKDATPAAIDILLAVQGEREDVVRLLVGRNARRDFSQLTSALKLPAATAVPMYLCLLEQGIAPENVTEAQKLCPLVEALQLPSDDLRLLVAAQRHYLELRQRHARSHHALTRARSAIEMLAQQTRTRLITGHPLKVLDYAQPNLEPDVRPASRTMYQHFVQWATRHVTLRLPWGGQPHPLLLTQG